MATGNKANNIIQADGQSWEDHYGIDADLLTNATRTNFLVQRLINPNGGKDFARAIYLGTGALTTSQFNNLPEGSEIIAPNIGTPTIYIKEGASTWNAIT